jgi:phytoene dehydrogenase-like protein
LLANPDFVAFVDEQLLITAQNTHEQVNVLFGATALCYTNYTNYYIPGGLIQLVHPLIEYVEQRRGQLHLRRGVERVETLADGRYRLYHKDQSWDFDLLLSGIPINNTLALWQGEAGEGLRRRLAKKLLDSPQLNSAFQLGLGVDLEHWPKALHHQIHLPAPLPQIGSKSIFLSLSHPEDVFRAPRGQAVASISTHIPNPGQQGALDKTALSAYILDVLAERGLLEQDKVRYQHSSDMLAWERWTGRAMGFVGGYPQWLHIKPWQMLDARLDQRGAYLCGDTCYPGQGIPGTCLSGWIAVRKMELDGNLG